MTLSLPLPGRRLQATLSVAVLVAAIAFVWACTRPAAERAADAQSPPAPPLAAAGPRARPTAVDPCAEALRLGEATPVDSKGRPLPPGQPGGAAPLGSPAKGGSGAPATTPAPRLWLTATGRGRGPGPGHDARAPATTPAPRGKPAAPGPASPQRVELQVFEHPEGGCLEVFVEGRLRGRLSTRTYPSGLSPQSGSSPAPVRGLRRLLRWPLSDPDPTPTPPGPAQGERDASPSPARAELRAGAPRGAEAAREARRRAARLAASRPRRGYVVYELNLAPGERHLELRAVGPGTVRLFGLAQHWRRPGVVVHNVGVSGAQTANVLPGDGDLIDRQLRRLDPALVVVMLGTNDAYDLQLTPERFERRFTGLVRRLKRSAASPDCLIITTPDFGDRHWRHARRLRRQAARLRAVQRKVAAAERCAVFDLYAAMGGAGAMSRLMRAHPPFAYRDQVHLTARAYRALGQLLHEALMQRYAAYLKARPRLKVTPPDPTAGATPRAIREEAEARRRWPTGLGPVALEDPGGKALARFFRSLVLLARKAPRASARVLFLGDSHVAGDQLVGELRSRLQRDFGDAGHGYVHAGTPWPGYARRGLRVGASGPWSYYYLRTRTGGEQPGDRFFGLGGISTWFTQPPAGLPSSRRPSAAPRTAGRPGAPGDPGSPDLPGGPDAATDPAASLPRTAPHPPPADDEP